MQLPAFGEHSVNVCKRHGLALTAGRAYLLPLSPTLPRWKVRSRGEDAWQASRNAEHIPPQEALGRQMRSRVSDFFVA